MTIYTTYFETMDIDESNYQNLDENLNENTNLYPEIDRPVQPPPDYGTPFLPSYSDWVPTPSCFLDINHRQSASQGAIHYDLRHIWFELGNIRGPDQIPNHHVSYTMDQHYVYMTIQLSDGTYIRIPCGRNGPPSYQTLVERETQECHTDQSLIVVNIPDRHQNIPMNERPYHRRLLHLQINEKHNFVPKYKWMSQKKENYQGRKTKKPKINKKMKKKPGKQEDWKQTRKNATIQKRQNKVAKQFSKTNRQHFQRKK